MRIVCWQQFAPNLAQLIGRTILNQQRNVIRQDRQTADAINVRPQNVAGRADQEPMRWNVHVVPLHVDGHVGQLIAEQKGAESMAQHFVAFLNDCVADRRFGLGRTHSVDE